MCHGGHPLRKGIRNGHVYLELFKNLFADLKCHYPELKVDLTRDEATLLKRFACEGLSFLTKTLPKLGKAIDLALSTGDSLVATGFHSRGKTGLPAFLWGFLSCIFNVDGTVKVDPDPGMILEVRQICYLLYKLEVPYEEVVVQEKVDAFVQLDADNTFDPNRLTGEDLSVLRQARVLCGLLLRDFSLEGSIPKHGPGATAGCELPWEKGEFKYFIEQLDEVFPYSEWMFLNRNHLVDELDRLLNMIPIDQRDLVSVMVPVNKDSRGPRLIGKEPQEMMWIQQLIKGALYQFLESHPLTKGRVNFTDQTINGRLALEASIDRENATLDLKDASNSVALKLVEYLLADTPLLPMLLATRTVGIELPDGHKHMYNMFAPMGSALCFPVEAIVFWSLACSTLIVRQNYPMWNAIQSVYVYGDDIVLPTGSAELVMQAFPSYGLHFNRDKCCVRGFFRESCGTDAYKGVDVTPLKVKKLLPCGEKAQQERARSLSGPPEAIASYVEYSNLFYERGYYRLADWIKSWVEGLLGRLPVLEQLEPQALVFRSRQGSRIPGRIRWQQDFQRYETRTWTLSPATYELEEGVKWDWDPLFRALLAMPERTKPLDWLPDSLKKEPLVFDVPHKTTLRKRWVPVWQCR